MKVTVVLLGVSILQLQLLSLTLIFSFPQDIEVLIREFLVSYLHQSVEKAAIFFDIARLIYLLRSLDALRVS